LSSASSVFTAEGKKLTEQIETNRFKSFFQKNTKLKAKKHTETNVVVFLRKCRIPKLKAAMKRSCKFFSDNFQLSVDRSGQCCQMVYFQTENPNLGKFCQVLLWKMLVFL
jgi:hypothetical protein